MAITKGTTQVRIRNVSKIDIIGKYSDNEPLQNTMNGENIEQGVTITITQGTSINVANGAKVTTSEKCNISWTLLGETLDQMESSSYFTGNYPSLFGYTITSVRITLIGGKTITILNPIISCSKIIKVGDIFRFTFNIEKNNDNIDNVVVFA